MALEYTDGGSAAHLGGVGWGEGSQLLMFVSKIYIYEREISLPGEHQCEWHSLTSGLEGTQKPQ